jgi:hypothetical protein
MRSVGSWFALLAGGALLVASSAFAAAPRVEAVQKRLGITRLSLQTLRLDSPARTVTLDLDGRRVMVRLERSSLRAPSFRVLVQTPDGALEETPAPAPAGYRGTVDGMPGSVVGGTIRNGRLTAAIGLADGRVFYIEPLDQPGSEPGAHIVYDAADVTDVEGVCGTTEPPVVVPEADGPGTAGAGPHVTEIAFDADYEYWQANGASVNATIADIENVLAAVNVIYERDCDITHQITTIIVRTAPSDPYSTTSASGLLTQFRDHWNSAQTGVIRDIAHLMTGKNLDGGTIGIAYLAAICSGSRGYGLSQSRWASVMSLRASLTAHELGHNWNANHCDGVSPCNIMCSTINQCDGIGVPNFEPQGVNAIRNYAATRSCLDTPRAAVAGPLPGGTVRFGPATPSVLTTETGTSLGFHLDRDMAVTLDVYDVAGHRVARLLAGVRPAGGHELVWAGRDDAGHAVKAGVYYARLAASGTILTRKLILLR